MKSRTREWARIGAKARLAEIDAERLAILNEFPDFRTAGSRVQSDTPRRRGKISAAARRRQRAGMRKYWAKRKAAAAKA